MKRSVFTVKMKFVLKCICLCVIMETSTTFVNTSYVRVRRQEDNEGCVLPQHPHQGQWTIYKETSQLRPGQIVPLNTILRITCQDGYGLDGDATMVCIEGDWTARVGHCLRTCSPRYSTSVMKVTCTYNDRKLDNCDAPIQGTKARFQCTDFYEAGELEKHPIHFCLNGRWSHNLPECVPTCGLKPAKASTQIIDEHADSFPWQVAIYRKSDKELLCGGTLLNQRVIVTAAHCVTNLQGEPFSKDVYMVAVGKYYRKYDHPDDIKYAQFSSISEIYVSRQYRGDVQQYFADIAILITSKTFQLSRRVIPICVDWGLQHREVLLNHTRTTDAYVSGWGFTAENKNPSDVLKELKISLINEKECNKRLAPESAEFLTDDKLCAAFLDPGKSVCKGDSGGGLVTRLGARYYFIGIISVSGRTSSTQIHACDNNQYALYTKVHDYIEDFLLQKEAEFRP